MLAIRGDHKTGKNWLNRRMNIHRNSATSILSYYLDLTLIHLFT